MINKRKIRKKKQRIQKIKFHISFTFEKRRLRLLFKSYKNAIRNFCFIFFRISIFYGGKIMKLELKNYKRRIEKQKIEIRAV